MIENSLPISGAATALGNQGLRKGQKLTAVGEDLNKVFIKKGLTTPSLQLCNPDTYDNADTYDLVRIGAGCVAGSNLKAFFRTASFLFRANPAKGFIGLYMEIV